MKKRILFVDDDAKVLQALERMLYPLRTEWEMRFVGGASEALTLLAQHPYDVIVSDMRMPDMDGAQLLAEVRHKHPQMIRVGLSGQSSQEMNLRAVRSAHQYLAKPCTPELLKATVTRLHNLGELLTNLPLQELVSRMRSLPSLSSLFLEMIEALKSTTVSLQDLSCIIEKDMGMSAKIMQLANSAFFGAQRRVDDLPRAIAALGLETIKELVLSLQIFSQCDPTPPSQCGLPSVWEHSFTIAVYARLIARLEHQPSHVVDAAFTAGLLHDCGELVLAINLPEVYSSVVTRAHTDRVSVREVERDTFGVSHAEIGAYLLGIWGLPDTIVETVAFHHDPGYQEKPPFGPLTAVYIAEALEHEQRTRVLDAASSPVDLAPLAKLGLSKRLPLWRAQCLAYTPGSAEQSTTHL
jgi:HD-like signal output (HDOD) protein